MVACLGLMKLEEEAWAVEFDRWAEPFLSAFHHKAQRRWAPVYLRGLLGPSERKSVEPMAAWVAPDDVEQLHHFVATSVWDTAPLERVLLNKADALVGGPDAFLIVDDTGIPKKGTCSVGVAHQYCGQLGKEANCQVLVSLTLAREDVPVPVALRLYLPKSWADDSARRAKAHVPEEVRFRPKWQIALEEIERVRAAGVHFGAVLADAGYGCCGDFRKRLSKMGLVWAVGIPGEQLVYPRSVRLRYPVHSGAGRPRKHGIPTAKRRSARDVMRSLRPEMFSTICWRKGTKGDLRADFAAIRVRVADGDDAGHHRRLPGEEVWLVIERRVDGTIRYHLTNLPADTPLLRIAEVIKARWSCELAHQQMKQELGLGHFEGRSWTGLHHHVVLTLVAFAFLEHLRRLPEAEDCELTPRTGVPSPCAAPSYPAVGDTHPMPSPWRERS